jgi:uncharacterized protein (TIGR02001 family)
MTKLSQAIALATAMTAGLVATSTSQAEVSASVDIASSYLYRGTSLGKSEAVVSGSLDYAHASGAYVGAWASSGDTENGSEYDIYFGYAGTAGSLSYDVGYASYIYPLMSEEAVADTSNNITATKDEIGDVTELYLNLSAAGVDFSTYFSDNGGDYVYNSLGYGMDKFYGLVGVNTDLEDDGKSAYTHIDVSYAYNDNVTFTASKIVAQSDGNSAASPQFVVSYSLPIE